MQADTFNTLSNIRRQTDSSIVSTLLDLQEDARFDNRTYEWIRKLEVIYLKASTGGSKRRWDNEIITGQDAKKLLCRRRINAYDPNKKYIAVSYTWESPLNQDSSQEAYIVQSRDRANAHSSKVRDQVLDRVIAYAKYCESREGPVQGFWLDQECIDQENEAEKQRAIQSIEHVYSHSAFPVALLSVQIKSQDQLKRLISVLKTENPPGNHERGWVRGILKLLHDITSDLWWRRGWTFQEDYCASTKMCLLIPHSSSLKELKEKNHRILGKLEGELCIKSTDFRSRVTKFCMYYRREPEFEAMCVDILDRASKYDVQLLEFDLEGMPTIRQSMSPIIFSNVGKRGITVESDRLAVIANCLDYSFRLDTRRIERKRCSLSIAMLALFLLNGEILVNGPSYSETALGSNIFEYLEKQSLRTFQTPDIDQKLRFIKRCRFAKVKLSEEGILTSGHLWRLGKIVEDARGTEPPVQGRNYKLNSYQRKRLGQLASHLGSGGCGSRYECIAQAIDTYLDEDKRWEGEGITFSKFYKDLMAEEIVKAMDDRYSCRLRLGSLIPRDECRGNNPYSGVFIREAGHRWTEKETYVFTAVWSDDKTIDDIEKHLSLEVELLGSSNRSDPKRLVIKRWINGLFFFDSSSPVTDVVFPWPNSFLV
ncbi:heterokaryon incompatibility protein-domain-containing protein [Aspergillus caelatus]|uniref:Heterokaryon incompatibility protein-domain-containing protein n=1 Tax=Aspergillus caelatus TaxID=61420 RepID=A0A5N7A3K0_9EURO|nr:heterokaryon incompatibility protein-domain-containing protein [Aspergillus caelatus]KAE8364275.1 heterokaryon incompatibility protein-domain-containing protein [Aspergillus caelatus]